MSFAFRAARSLIVVSCAAGVFMTEAGGQQGQTTAEITSKDSPVTFSTAVTLVLIPVVVRDAQGHAVGTLTKDDFQIVDKGKPQTITRFSIEKAETPPVLPDTSLETDAEGNAKTKPQGTPAGEAAASHFTMWLFDDMHLSFGDLAQAREAAKRALKEAYAPGFRAAVYTTSGHTQLDFTDDRDKLEATLNEIKPWPTIPTDAALKPCPDIGYFQADRMINGNDLEAARAAQVDYLSCPDAIGITTQANEARAANQNPNSAVQSATSQAVRMLALKEVEIGFQDTRNTLLVLKGLVRRMAVMPGSRAIVMVSPGFYLVSDHRTDEMDIINAAIRSNVIISSLDARGLYALAPGGTADTPLGVIDTATVNLKASYERQTALAQMDIMEELAEGTGGTFVHDDNDFYTGLRRIASQPEFIYVLGFSPQNMKLDGSYRTVKVTLKNNDKLQVQARRGYFERNRVSDPVEQAKEELKDAFFSRDELTELPVELHTQFFKTGDYNARVSIMARVDVRGLKYKKADGRNNDMLTVVGGVFDRDGKYIAGTQKDINLKLKDETLQTIPQGGITVKSNLDVASGSYIVRLVVRDSEGEVMGAQNGALEIP